MDTEATKAFEIKEKADGQSEAWRAGHDQRTNRQSGRYSETVCPPLSPSSPYAHSGSNSDMIAGSKRRKLQGQQSEKDSASEGDDSDAD